MKVWKITGLVVLAVVIVVVGFAIFGNGNASPGDEGQVVEVKRGNLETTVSASGSVVAPHQAKLSFESAGTVSELSVEVGDRVQKGQVLARLEISSLERAVATAEANLRTAQLNLEKAQNLYDEKDFAQARAALAQAEANLESAQFDLKEAREPYDDADWAQARADLASALVALQKAQEPYTADELAQARASVETAQASLIAEQEALDQFPQDQVAAQAKVVSAQEALAAAELKLEATIQAQARTVKDRENTLADVKKAYQDLLISHYSITLPEETIYQDPREVLSVETVPDAIDRAWKAAVKARDDLEVARSQEEEAVTTAQNNLTKAREALRKAKESLETLAGPSSQELGKRSFQLKAAQLSLEEAQDKLARISGTDPQEAKRRAQELASAQAKLEKAQAGLAEIEAGPDPQEVAMKEAQVRAAQDALAQAQAELADMKAGPDPVDIELKEIQVTNAEIALAGAREKLEKATIIAPFDGLVASVNNKVRDVVVAGAAIIQFIDPGEFEVEAIVDELDVYQVRPGQAVQVSLDAIPQATLAGEVKALSPVAQRETGVISYKVTISLQPPEDFTLKDGLTASTEIVVASRLNVLLVPSRAVSRSGEDSLVQVMVNGQPQERIVITGISSEGQTEILSGLSEGERVLVKESRD